MIFKQGRPMVYAMITLLACVTSTTLGHYADMWQSGYVIGCGFAIMTGLLIYIIDGEV
jgi:low affinity Fe/Cu permease